MMKVKREGIGTLCDTCKSSVIMRGPGGEQAVYCRVLERPLEFPVLDCNKYRDLKQLDHYEMEDMAWLLITEAKHGQKVGFYSPQERKKRDIEMDPTPGL